MRKFIVFSFLLMQFIIGISQDDNIKSCKQLPLLYNIPIYFDSTFIVGIKDSIFDAGYSDSTNNRFYIDNKLEYHEKFDSLSSFVYLRDFPNAYVLFNDLEEKTSNVKIYDVENCIYKEFGFYDKGMTVFYCDYSKEDDCYSKMIHDDVIEETRYIPIHKTNYEYKDLSISGFCRERNIIPTSSRTYYENAKTGNDTIIIEELPIELYLRNSPVNPK